MTPAAPCAIVTVAAVCLGRVPVDNPVGLKPTIPPPHTVDAAFAFLLETDPAPGQTPRPPLFHNMVTNPSLQSVSGFSIP